MVFSFGTKKYKMIDDVNTSSKFKKNMYVSFEISKL